MVHSGVPSRRKNPHHSDCDIMGYKSKKYGIYWEIDDIEDVYEINSKHIGETDSIVDARKKAYTTLIRYPGRKVIEIDNPHLDIVGKVIRHKNGSITYDCVKNGRLVSLPLRANGSVSTVKK